MAVALTSAQRAVAGEVASSNVALNVEVYAWYITAPVWWLTPIDGSPALWTSALRESGGV